MTKTFSDATRVAHAGRAPARNSGLVNPPVEHASTILFSSLTELDERSKNKLKPGNVNYGRQGTPARFAFEDAIAELEGGGDACVTSSGLAAITTALLAFVAAGDHILVPDSVYTPTRLFCDHFLKKMGVETTYYDPNGNITPLMTERTTVVFAESPGSLTFDMQDIPALAQRAHDGGAVVILDNTWGTPLYCKSFDLGVDVSVHAATKYIVGHSDAMLGLIVTKSAHSTAIRRSADHLGQCAGPDDIYLAQRGLRTLAVRLKQHHTNGLALAQWLEQHPKVSRVLHPALPHHPGHAIWQRDFKGACGLFSIVLDQHYNRAALGAMIDHMELFGLGYSWGGYESLILPESPIRTATDWVPKGTLVRLHIGLEDPDDLKNDLDAGFNRLCEG